MQDIEWTNESVLRFANGRDPVEAIQEAARRQVLAAFDAGWHGPPFNPIGLADIRGIPVEASADVRDARTVAREGCLRIQFNPTQPRGRVRFSIAHEVAHTLFEDVADVDRHRGGSGALDDWQLEMLCNIAASEFVMPVSSLGPVETVAPIEHLMTRRQEFDVSTEAYLLRVVKVASEPVIVALASPRQGSPVRYKVDYAVASKGWNGAVPGLLPPSRSVLEECTAVGFTMRGDEDWPGLGKVGVECVGVPGYPGALLPRVACLLRPSTAAAGAARPAITYLQGDVLRPRGSGRRIIATLVNDAARKWGGGVARSAARAHPGAEADFAAWIGAIPAARRLGSVHLAAIGDGLVLASLVGQAGFGPGRTPRIRYSALSSALGQVAEEAVRQGASVHMPRLGTGAAGGEWAVVEQIVEDQLLSRGIHTTVYDPPPGREVRHPDLFS